MPHQLHAHGYWTPALSALLFKRNAEFRRDPHSEACKAATRAFRQQHRQASRQFMARRRNLLHTNLLTDKRAYFKCCNVIFGRSRLLPATIKFGERFVSKDSEIAASFAQQFYTLDKPPVLSAADLEFVTHYAKSHEDFEALLPGVIECALSAVKSGTCAGDDGLLPEHWKLAPRQLLVPLLVANFNYMIQSGNIDESFRCGRVTPVLKSRKSAQCATSYRPITVISSKAHLFEHALLSVLESSWINPLKLMPLQQAAFCRFRSGLEHLFSLTQLVDRSFREKRDVIGIFFDIKAAYDSVDIDLLFVQLARLGMPRHIWSLLRSWYQRSFVYVRVRGARSEQQQILRGVFQGGVLSPSLYALFLRNLSTELAFVQIAGYPSHFLFADDLATLTLDAATAQRIVDVCVRFGDRHHFRWSETKTEAVVFHSKKLHRPAIDCNLLMYDRPIKFSDSFCYLGVPLRSDLSMSDTVNDRMRKARFSANAIRVMQHRNSLTMPVLSQLISQRFLSSLTYASPIWTTTQLSAMDSLLWRTGRQLLGVHASAPAAFVQCELGWLSVTAHTHIALLSFCQKLLNLPVENVARMLFVDRLDVMLDEPARIPADRFFSTLFSITRRYKLRLETLRQPDSEAFAKWRTTCREHAGLFEFDQCRIALQKKRSLDCYYPLVAPQTKLHLQPYLMKFLNVELRRSVAQVRSGWFADLAAGRVANATRDRRLCSGCLLPVPSAFHYLSCPAFADVLADWLTEFLMRLSPAAFVAALNPRLLAAACFGNTTDTKFMLFAAILSQRVLTRWRLLSTMPL